MTADETTCFKLLDDYARSQHRCFLAEMDRNNVRARYSLCFRPTGGDEHTPNYTYRYLYIGVDDVRTAGQANTLPASVVEMLDAQLPSLATEISQSD